MLHPGVENRVKLQRYLLKRMVTLLDQSQADGYTADYDQSQADGYAVRSESSGWLRC